MLELVTVICQSGLIIYGCILRDYCVAQAKLSPVNQHPSDRGVAHRVDRVVCPHGERGQLPPGPHKVVGRARRPARNAHSGLLPCDGAHIARLRSPGCATTGPPSSPIPQPDGKRKSCSVRPSITCLGSQLLRRAQGSACWHSYATGKRLDVSPACMTAFRSDLISIQPTTWPSLLELNSKFGSRTCTGVFFGFAKQEMSGKVRGTQQKTCSAPKTCTALASMLCQPTVAVRDRRYRNASTLVSVVTVNHGSGRQRSRITQKGTVAPCC
jgi:hypothetical protein